MKARFNSQIECTNWTYGKDYNVKGYPPHLYVIIRDDNGSEQVIQYGDSDFVWAK